MSVQDQINNGKIAQTVYDGASNSMRAAKGIIARLTRQEFTGMNLSELARVKDEAANLVKYLERAYTLEAIARGKAV